MKIVTTACAIALGVALCGCKSSKETKIYKDDQPDTVIVEKKTPVVVDHAHHYYYNGRWYMEPEHITIVED